jgi:putative ABC transport system ATP-binding protein
MSIIIRDLMKVYRTGRSEVIALRGLDATIETGEFVAIMGPSGCGKTTLLNIIGGLDMPTAGSVNVNGVNIVSYTEKEFVEYRRNYVGVVFQFFNLVPTLTARENIELPMILAKMPAPARRERVNSLLQSVGMMERADHRPDELSGGEQQRIAVSVALANDPPILLADEPTGELDSATGADIVNLFKNLHKDRKKTVLIVTHDSRVAHSADRILQMEDGKLIREELGGQATYSPPPPPTQVKKPSPIRAIRRPERTGDRPPPPPPDSR